MPNVLDYLEWRGDLSLKNTAFNDVDALILSRISYIPFDGIVSENIDDKMTIENAAKLFAEREENHKMICWKGDLDFIEMLPKCDRFKNMKLSGYINIIEPKKQMQFSAVIIEMDENKHFISFRGTDTSVVGWQEDFNMYYMFPLPSQARAKEYLENAASNLKGTLILGGHSKGGNLAVYSSAFCCKKIQDRILTVYNHDGPGFDKKVITQDGFKAITNKIRTYVPQSSIIGMMLEHQEEFTIIKSNQKGFMQHDIYTWEVNKNGFIHLNTMSGTSIFFDHTLNDFVSNLSIDQRKEFVEGLFSLLENTEDKTFNEILENWVTNSGVILKTLKNMDSKTRNMILSTLLDFIKCAKNNFSDINPLRKENRKHRNITAKSN